MTSEYENAAHYYDRIPEEELTVHDYINRGHIELCRESKKEAIRFYKMALGSKNVNLKEFVSIIIGDREYLNQHGIQNEEIPLLLDYLRYDE